MAKEKFILTEELVSVNKDLEKKEIRNFKERISLNIDSGLKRKLVIYCAKNNINLTSAIEKSIKRFLINTD
tara:strand:+ start:121 stop:333 length:213 start_codon:yes stop_codon:yes gene_type:complete